MPGKTIQIDKQHKDDPLYLTIRRSDGKVLAELMITEFPGSSGAIEISRHPFLLTIESYGENSRKQATLFRQESAKITIT